jgi:addiction module HigA family antidote
MMPMKKPVHPGELVKANLGELELTVAKAAGALGITRQQLYNVISGKSAVTATMAVRFEKAFGGSADMWLRMQAAYDLAQVRQREGQIAVRRLGRSEAPRPG